MELKMKSHKKSYLLRYSIKDVGCDTRCRSIVIQATSLPYAIENLTQILNGMYKNFVIVY